MGLFLLLNRVELVHKLLDLLGDRRLKPRTASLHKFVKHRSGLRGRRPVHLHRGLVLAFAVRRHVGVLESALARAGVFENECPLQRERPVERVLLLAPRHGHRAVPLQAYHLPHRHHAHPVGKLAGSLQQQLFQPPFPPRRVASLLPRASGVPGRRSRHGRRLRLSARRTAAIVGSELLGRNVAYEGFCLVVQVVVEESGFAPIRGHFVASELFFLGAAR
mmetsp:Transcript_6876/g.14116  ORF Transcript_6876/g.14116 Transcript_6876/m.14116 type:complete len:220 (-) Transcript_6876:630-1289(-)